MPKGLPPSALALLNQLFASAGISTIPGQWIVAGSVSLDQLNLVDVDSRYDARYAPASAASVADSAVQPGDDWTSTIGGTAVSVLLARALNGETAYSWGNHATAGYLTTAPVMKLYQVTGVTGNLTLPEAPVAGSQVLVFKNNLMLRLTTDWSRSGTAITLVIGSIAGDLWDIYYQA